MTKQQLIEALNRDLAAEYQAVVMYTTYAALVTGPHRPTLRQFFLAEVPEELAHAGFLADKISSLGGTPTTRPLEVPVATDPESMLLNVLEAEASAVGAYKARAEQAAALDEKALATRLETMVEEETAHHDETALILRGWYVPAREAIEVPANS